MSFWGDRKVPITYGETAFCESTRLLKYSKWVYKIVRYEFYFIKYQVVGWRSQGSMQVSYPGAQELLISPWWYVTCSCKYDKWFFSVLPNQILLNPAHQDFWFEMQWIFDMANRNETSCYMKCPQFNIAHNKMYTLGHNRHDFVLMGCYIGQEAHS